MKSECPNGGGGGGGGACFSCGEEGHMKWDCPTGGGNSGVCYNCGEEGHLVCLSFFPSSFLSPSRLFFLYRLGYE